MAATEAATGLNRPEILLPIPDVANRRVVVTGSAGFLGSRIVDTLGEHGAQTFGLDLPNWSILRPIPAERDAVCLHLAAHKYATTAEEIPTSVAELNIIGTQNVVDACGANTVLVSTCKAADPMTVYGASKLIAERIVLNAGGKVVRLVNVIGSSGSVGEIWGALPAWEPLPVVMALRMWMTAEEAVRLIVAAQDWPSGRYALDVPPPEFVGDLASRLYPGRAQRTLEIRRGDRFCERLVAEYESCEQWAHGVIQIHHPADA